MALITVSGPPGGRSDEVGRLAAHRLGYEFLNETVLESMVAEEFGAEAVIPDRAWQHVIASIVARLATESHLVVVMSAAELLFKHFPGRLRVYVAASDNRRIGNLMVDKRLERPAAKSLLGELDRSDREWRRRRFGRTKFQAPQLDLMLNEDSLETEQIARVIEAAVEVKGIGEEGFLPGSAEAQMQFQYRLQLAKHGMAPPGKVKLKHAQFGHPSEEIFANLLDFYRIAWEYEPRSFAIHWDEHGKVTEAFTPDFYLPEFDLYVELTTMKQSHVTKKNRKVKMMKSLYPKINIQVFYQKDFKNIVFKHGLTDRPAAV
jgi:cytidylate kinase